MKTNLKITLLLTSMLFSVTSTQAHITYGGSARDFGSFQPELVANSVTKTGTATTNFGWVDGTDADFGDAHHTRAFRFTLANAGSVTITATASTNGGAALAGLLPAFSLYSGLVHLTGGSDYDTSPISLSYLSSLGVPQPREGAFDALHTWKIGNDAGTTFADLTTLFYIGNAADGTSATYGNAVEINGDGLADGVVSATFNLAAGDYSLFIGGGDINGTDTTGSYDISANVSTVPEPSTWLMIVAAGGIFWMLRRRKMVVQEVI